MKKVIVTLGLIVGLFGTVEARHSSYGNWDQGTGSNPSYERVDGYERQNGSYVAPYYRTKSDDTLDNNYGTRGNENPWNGKEGNGETDADRENNPYKLYQPR